MAERGHARKEHTGLVVSDRMVQTRVVRVEALRRHPLYGKTIRHVKRYKAHDEHNESRAGDTVVIAETRPMSKDKRWRIVRVLERGHMEALPEEVTREEKTGSASPEPEAGAAER